MSLSRMLPTPDAGTTCRVPNDRSGRGSRAGPTPMAMRRRYQHRSAGDATKAENGSGTARLTFQVASTPIGGSPRRHAAGAEEWAPPLTSMSNPATCSRR